MGISASTLSRQRAADGNATEARESTVESAESSAVRRQQQPSDGNLDQVHSCSAVSGTTSSSDDEDDAEDAEDDEMDGDDDGAESNGHSNNTSDRSATNYHQRQGRAPSARQHDDVGAVQESESATTAMATNANDTSVQVTDRDVDHPVAASASTSTKNSVADKSLAEFREELRVKREQRRTAIADLKNEVLQLRRDLSDERQVSQRLREQAAAVGVAKLTASSREDEEEVSSGSEDSGDDEVDARARNADDGAEEGGQGRSVEMILRMQLANVNHQLQLANGDVLSLQAELAVTQKQVGTLKEVIGVSKEMVQIREAQLEQLKTKLKEIEESLAERELALMSDTLRKEYDRQLANIRSLRTLYEERARVSAAEKENMLRQLDTKRTELETEIEKSQGLEERVATLESELQDSANNLINVKDDLIDCKAEKRGLEDETAAINNLFSQLLTGFAGGNDLNIDKLSKMLEENRDLLSDITNNETCKNRAAAMPKLLLDLVTQIEEKPKADDENDCAAEDIALNAPTSSNTATPIDINPSVAKKVEILSNLPKVWKVLIELLNHQTVETVPFKENGESEDCYKLVQSPTGPQNVLSVSKTYIRLKDLIVEKKFLQKETHKLKNLNSHLETRLDQKERRLATVTVELNKTWTLVGRMQRQYRQLHTNEQVLRYQLSQKRRVLNELKEELEYCRRKWTQAREKNDESQTQWNSLRREFTARKLQDTGSQQSAESGFSDDPQSDEEQIPDRDELIFNVVDEVDKECEPLVVNPPVVVQVHQEASTSGGLPAKADVNHVKLSSKTRKKNLKTPKTPKATTGTESLEQMFNRISGIETHESEPEESDDSDDECEYDADVDVFVDEDTQSISELIATPEQIASGDDAGSTTESAPQTLSDAVDSEDEERRQRRAIRFERLEEQCQQLIQQVLRTSSRGEDLNKQIDQVHNRYKTPTPEASTSTASDEVSACPSASTSSNETSAETTADNACLTDKEQEYTSRRAARLKRLEEECQTFLNRVSCSNTRATALSNHATSLHEYHSARLGSGATTRTDGASDGSAELEASTTSDLHESKETDHVDNQTTNTLTASLDVESPITVHDDVNQPTVSEATAHTEIVAEVTNDINLTTADPDPTEAGGEISTSMNLNTDQQQETD